VYGCAGVLRVDVRACVREGGGRAAREVVIDEGEVVWEKEQAAETSMGVRAA